MHSIRTRRLTAGAVVVTLVAGLMAFVATQPASANHGSAKLEVTREVSSGPIGTTGVTLTARLVASNGTAVNTTGVNIDFEVESGPADSEGGAVTRTAPDATCDTVGGTCDVVLTSATQPGVSFVRAWIDHDDDDATVTADRTEGRLSSTTTDCTTELPAPAGTGASNRSDFNACMAATDGEAQPGEVGERDETDVVKVTFFRPAAALYLDCPEATVGPTEDDIVVTCTVIDADGFPRSGVFVDGVHQSGANDPNGDGPTDGGAADYNGAPASDQNGRVTLTVNTTAEPGFQTGPARICAWIDGDSEDDNDLGSGTAADNPSYDSTGSEDDGGLCDTEPAPGAADVSNNNTDRFFVEWQDRALSALDVAPDLPASSTVGGSHTLTATALDQFGAGWTASNTVIKGEFFSGSPKDTDANTPATPDLGTCNTNAGAGDEDMARCTFTYTSAPAAGTDVMCFWFGTAPSMTGSGTATATCTSDGAGEKLVGGTDAPRVDVVSKSWTAANTTTTTQPNNNTTTGAGNDQGYTLVGADGGIFTYGTSKFHGSTGDIDLNEPVIGLANKKGGTGYWLVAKDGGIFSFGDAEFFGSMGDKKLNAPILGMEATPSGRGYYLFAADGGIFSFGDAVFHGSTGDRKLNKPAVGLAVNQRGDGYWIVAQDGGIFSFGRVPFHGSTGDRDLNEPVFDMAPTAGDNGYWLVAKDGGVFSFGDAVGKFYGSAVGKATAPVIGMGATPSFNGYWIADANGAVFHFGDALFLGDRRGQAENAATVGFATVPKQ